jgi:hypothetical protein
MSLYFADSDYEGQCDPSYLIKSTHIPCLFETHDGAAIQPSENGPH